MRILVVNSDWPVDILQRYNIDHLMIAKKTNKFLRVIHVIDNRFKLLRNHFWDKKEWWKACIGYDLIILLDSTKDTVYQAEMIEKVAEPTTRLVFFMLNPLSYSQDLHLISKKWEKWSFSQKESLENNFRYGETFYFKEYVNLNCKSEIKFDTFFVGLDKGRMNYLNELKLFFDKEKLITLFYIVDNLKSIYNKQFKKRLSYQEVILLVLSSKSILDVVQAEQEGMTLRVMESIFFKKKLITNNSAIKNRNIYNPENVFILGEDNSSELSSFLMKPYREIDSELVKKYEFESWFNRIVLNQEFN